MNFENDDTPTPGMIFLAVLTAMQVRPDSITCPREARAHGIAELAAFYADEDFPAWEAANLHAELDSYLWQFQQGFRFVAVDFTELAELVGPRVARTALLLAGLRPGASRDGSVSWTDRPQGRAGRTVPVSFKGMAWDDERLRPAKR